MPFSQYSTLEKALKAFKISWHEEMFVVASAVEVSAILRDEIAFTREFIGLPRSESRSRENLIYPILRETWKHFPQMQLWSHEPLEFDADLTGVPDYFLTLRLQEGRMVAQHPYLLVIETKKDDFDWGWGQCLAGMVAARKLNNWPDQVVFGIVTNGTTWQFAKLVADRFAQDPIFVNWLPLENVCGAVHFMFEQCRLQLANYAGAA